MKLSEVFPAIEVVRDGEFTQFDQASASTPGSLVYCATAKFMAMAMANANVAAIITTAPFAEQVPQKPLVVTANPRLAYFRAYRDLKLSGRIDYKMDFGRGTGCKIHPTAVVSDRCRLGDDVVVEAFAIVGDHVEIQSGAYIGPGAKIGMDGLMPVWDEQGNLLRFPHAGGVSIGKNTVILAGSAVVTSVFQRPTRISGNCSIGLLTNIGHDVNIGNRCVIGGNCIISGGACLEDDVQVWASSSVAHGCTIGHKATVYMGSVVVRDVPPGENVSGNYAYNHRRHATAHLRKP